VILDHVRLSSQGIGDRGMPWVFIAKLRLSLLGMSWHIIQVQTQLGSAIQSRLTFWDFYEANFGKLRLIMNISFQVRHTSTATISIRSTYTPLHSAHFIFVCFVLILFPPALTRWMLSRHVTDEHMKGKLCLRYCQIDS